MSEKTQEKIAVGLVQMSCSDNPDENLEKAVRMVREAAAKGAKVVALPELFRSRYFCQINDKKFFSLAETIPGPSTEVLAPLAKELNISIIASLFERTADFKYYNTIVTLFPDGSVSEKYRKVHIPDDPENHYSELFYFTPGDLGYKTYNTPQATIGTLVCWDQWYPEAARATALQGAEVLFYPTAIGWQLSQQNQRVGNAEFDAWVTIQRSHAIANGVYVVAINRIGLEDHINFWGGSFVADPYGQILAQASHDKEEVLVVECDRSFISTFRKDWPFLTCRRIDTYAPLTQPFKEKA